MTNNTPDPMGKFKEDEELFDAGRADQMKGDLLERFSSNSKLVERITLAYMAILMLGVIFLWSQVIQAEDTRTQILYASLFVTLMVGTMTMKMWYWMMRVKFSLIKEMKLTRYEIIRGTSASFEMDETGHFGLSPTERTIWYISILIWMMLLLLKFPILF
jgi:Family of unknown function (DUF6768)